MIPQILHSVLVGRTELTELEERCLRTWEEVIVGHTWCARYEWRNDDGIDSQFLRESIIHRPINASNYLRYWALHEFGGIYLDNDVEVLKPFDLSLDAFVGFQRDDSDKECVNVAVMGFRAGHPLLKRILDRLDADTWEAYPVWTGPGILTDELRAMGLKGVNVEQVVGEVTVYDKERFYPWRWDEPPDRSRITERTIAVHHWGKTWVP